MLYITIPKTTTLILFNCLPLKLPKVACMNAEQMLRVLHIWKWRVTKLSQQCCLSQVRKSINFKDSSYYIKSVTWKCLLYFVEEVSSLAAKQICFRIVLIEEHFTTTKCLNLFVCHPILLQQFTQWIIHLKLILNG